MLIHSPDFQHNAMIPRKFACDGDDVSPTLIFENIPEGTKSLVLIMDDPDAEVGKFVHWMVWNLPPTTSNLSDDSIPESASVGIGSSGIKGYVGPCPPRGTHHYEFHLYALDKVLDAEDNTTREELDQSMGGSILEKAKLVGIYSK